MFTKFGKSSKDSGFSIRQRDNLLDLVYKQIYVSSSRGGAGGRAIFWQLMAEGMSSYGDGYEVVFSQNPSTMAEGMSSYRYGYEVVLSLNPSTTSIILAQSHKLAKLTHMVTTSIISLSILKYPFRIF